jgi:hypothetical protein
LPPNRTNKNHKSGRAELPLRPLFPIKRSAFDENPFAPMAESTDFVMIACHGYSEKQTFWNEFYRRMSAAMSSFFLAKSFGNHN